MPQITADVNQNELSLAETQSSQRKIEDIVDSDELPRGNQRGAIRENIILPTLSAPGGAKIMQK